MGATTAPYRLVGQLRPGDVVRARPDRAEVVQDATVVSCIEQIPDYDGRRDFDAFRFVARFADGREKSYICPGEQKIRLTGVTR
jgi:hypothetical protein